ncbi:MAG: DUF4140 domain-containing protein [Flavobacteriales bacterium]|nr:DUF4140 domain-containing protein [Flavobacteriales bacterium]
MKTYTILSVFLLTCAGMMAQKTIEVVPNIKAVTVFHVGAEITSESKASIPQGQQVIILKGVSKKVVSDNIRAYIRGNGDDLLLIKSSIVIKSDTTWQEVKKGPKVRQSTIDSAELLAKQYADLSTEESILSNQFNLMKTKLGEVEMKTVEDATKLFDLYETRMIKLESKLLATRTKKNKIQGLLGTYQNYARKRSITGPTKKIRTIEKFHSLKLVVQATKALSGTLVIKYIVGATGWAPKYRLMANT